jgi:hypothetical protein
MSRDQRFLSLGREGWVLASSVTPATDQMRAVASQYVEAKDDAFINQLNEDFNTLGETPAIVDREILHWARTNVGRNLIEIEKRELRRFLKHEVEIRAMV